MRDCPWFWEVSKINLGEGTYNFEGYFDFIECNRRRPHPKKKKVSEGDIINFFLQ